jgi:hypothetical protein
MIFEYWSLPVLQYRRKLGPTFTPREQLFYAFAFLSAGLAAFGMVELTHPVVDDSESDYTISLFFGLSIFGFLVSFAALGIEHVRRKRRDLEMKE